MPAARFIVMSWNRLECPLQISLERRTMPYTWNLRRISVRNFVKIFKRIRAPRQMPSSIRRLVAPQLKTGNIGIGNTFRCILPGVTSIARQLQKLVGTAFHRRPRSAVERRPYQNAEVLQQSRRSVKTGQTCFLTFSLLSTNHESPSTNHEILLYYPHRKSRRKSRHRLKQTETRCRTLRGRSFR